jgi:hypothetical protein
MMKRAEDQLPPVLSHHLAERELADGARLLRGRERLGLDELQAHPQADDDHHRREQERHPPSPRQELLGALRPAVRVGQREVDDEEHRVGDDEADRGAELGERAVPRALALGRVLGRHERGAGPFAAEREALEQTQHEQEERSRPADLVVRGEASDEEGRDAHGEQRRDECRLAPEPVSEVAEDDGADRAGDHRAPNTANDDSSAVVSSPVGKKRSGKTSTAAVA